VRGEFRLEVDGGRELMPIMIFGALSGERFFNGQPGLGSAYCIKQEDPESEEPGRVQGECDPMYYVNARRSN
jgi:hypothetical protein